MYINLFVIITINVFICRQYRFCKSMMNFCAEKFLYYIITSKNLSRLSDICILSAFLYIKLYSLN